MIGGLLMSENTAPQASPATVGLTPGLLALIVAIPVACSTITGGLVVAAALWLGHVPVPPGPTPPAPVIDAKFVELGKSYGPALVAAYAENWQVMADRVDAGKPIGEAVTAFGVDWTARRNDLFDAQLAGPFKALVPEGATEDTITATQRSAYAAAARGVAKGLIDAEP